MRDATRAIHPPGGRGFEESTHEAIERILKNDSILIKFHYF